jgi:hypothetical protein
MGAMDVGGEAASLAATGLTVPRVVFVVSRNYCQEPIHALCRFFVPWFARDRSHIGHGRVEQNIQLRKSCN